ncbi:MAG TPA: damage-inducible protein DinB [Rhodobacteraceae bacterium]|nr:damage-inducible protein DinB [Paracoccaceae bacterium]
MITPDYCRTMARYNAWQNRSLYGAADGLDDAARRLDRGAFFKSIHATLSHLLWGDTIWMSRFDGWEAPATNLDGSPAYEEDWGALKSARLSADARMADWAGRVTPGDLTGDISWFSQAIGREITMPRDLLVMQMFNHQTHHRRQVHAMLTAAGARPDDTDLPFMPEE